MASNGMRTICVAYKDYVYGNYLNFINAVQIIYPSITYIIGQHAGVPFSYLRFQYIFKNFVRKQLITLSQTEHLRKNFSYSRVNVLMPPLLGIECCMFHIVHIKKHMRCISDTNSILEIVSRSLVVPFPHLITTAHCFFNFFFFFFLLLVSQTLKFVSQYLIYPTIAYIKFV